MWIDRFKSSNSIISIGTVSRNLWTIEDIDKIMKEHQDKDLYFRVGVRTELQWTDEFWKNKITDDDIKEINRIYVDLDLRKKFKGNLSDEEIRSMAEILKERLDKHPLFKQWTHIVFSWNWLHIHYIWDYITIESTLYANIARKFYELFDKDILQTAPLNFCPTDKSNQNISRLMRLPDSYNQRKAFDDLSPVQVEILYEQDVKCDYLESYQQYIWNLLEQQVDKEYESYSSDEKHIYKNMRKEFIAYICSKTWLHIQPDGKNLWGWHNPNNKAFFLHEKVNKLIMSEESTYLPKPINGSHHTFVSLVMQIENLSKENACKYILNKYEPKQETKWLTIFRWGAIDFLEKYKFTRGLDKINKALGKFHTWQMIILVWKAGMGKTEFCFHMAKNNAMIGNKVAYLSMEMKAADLVKRSARQYAHINKLERSDKNLTEEQKEDFTKHYKYFVNINNLQIVSFDDETTIDVVEKYILELHTQWANLFFIDNLWFFTGGINELERFAEISRRLKKLTNGYPLSIILLHHIKKTESKDEYKPGTSNDIRWNQKLVDDADKVVQIRRNTDKKLEDLIEKQTVYLLIHKDREFWEFGEIDFFFNDGNYYDNLNPF